MCRNSEAKGVSHRRKLLLSGEFFNEKRFGYKYKFFMVPYILVRLIGKREKEETSESKGKLGFSAI